MTTLVSGPVETEQVAIPAADGFALAGSVYTPRAAGDQAVVVVAPATGVRRSLYRPFAEHLAGAGHTVVTWDWRGTGGSRPSSLRGFRATMRDWAERDLAGAIDWAAARQPGAALLAVGHSFGGQAIGLAPNAGRLRGLVTVAAQSGYWRLWPTPQRYAYAVLWTAALPALVRAFGYFPARRLRVGEDLPAGVALEWARWCRSPTYLGDYTGHRRFAAPILALSFADDPFAPRRAVAALHAEYGSVAQRHHHVRPAELGLRRIGHFGFFRPTATALWEQTARWIAEAAGSGEGQA